MVTGEVNQSNHKKGLPRNGVNSSSTTEFSGNEVFLPPLKVGPSYIT